jgi:hypothetical protein
MTINFKPEQKPGEQLRYIYRGKDAEVVIYYGEPPLKPRGIYVWLRVPELGRVIIVFVRPLDHFDADALAAVADNFQLNTE